MARKQLCKEAYGVPVDNDFTKSLSLVAEEASSVLGCIRKNIVRRLKEVILPPLLDDGEDYSWSPAPNSEALQDKRHGHTAASLVRAEKPIKGSEHLRY